MKAIQYRIQDTNTVTENPCQAEMWMLRGEIVEVIDNGEIINTVFK